METTPVAHPFKKESGGLNPRIELKECCYLQPIPNTADRGRPNANRF